MEEDPLDLEDKDLGELGGLNDFYKRNARAESKAAKAKGGSGANRLDESARSFSQKQIQVEAEIHDRLMAQHEDRSMRSQELDEELKAPLAESPEEWSEDPSHSDWPGIDTPRD